MTVRILRGDCRDVLPTLPAKSVHCVVTSPPYFGLRDYGVAGQIGLEPSPEAFVMEMVEVFREVRRVLRPEGTCWLNLGDSYAGSRCGPQGMLGEMADRSITSQRVMRQVDGSHKARSGAKPKDLLMMPARVALALQADGWWIRKDIIWAKPNPMPESATDRPTSSHEHVFLLTKTERYFYDADAVREPMTSSSAARLAQDVEAQAGSLRANGGAKTNGRMKAVAKGNAKTFRGGGAYVQGRSFDNGGEVERDSRGNAPNQAGTRNLRDVWTISSQPFSQAHFATFPPKLVEPCILAGTSAHGCCPTCGAPWKRVVARGEPDLPHQRASGGDAAGEYHGQSNKDYAAAGVQDASAVKARILAGMVKKQTTGWRPTCECPEHQAIPCTVLDPFGGAGTTGLVADRLGRDAVLIELNPAYANIAGNRIKRDSSLLSQVDIQEAASG